MSLGITVHAVCDECGGTGQVYADLWDAKGEHYTEQRDCATCQGTGDIVVDDEEESIEPFPCGVFSIEDTRENR